MEGDSPRILEKGFHGLIYFEVKYTIIIGFQKLSVVVSVYNDM